MDLKWRELLHGGVLNCRDHIPVGLTYIMYHYIMHTSNGALVMSFMMTFIMFISHFTKYNIGNLRKLHEQFYRVICLCIINHLASPMFIFLLT